MSDVPAVEKPRHPKGLYVLFATEMWERFSFYLMIGIFYQYLVDSQTGGMGWDGVKAASVFGTYIGLVYFTPFLGGIVADRLLGPRKTVIVGGVFFVIGHVTLAVPGEAALYIALLALVIGNGLFKPNISTMVGNLYPKDSPLRDNAYTIFYMGINVGGFSCNFVAAIVRNIWGWHAAFATAGIGMAIGLVVFLLFQKHIRAADVDPKKETGPRESLTPLWVECLIPAALFAVGGWFLAAQFELALGPATTAFLLACLPAVFFFVRVWSKLKDPGERGRTAALLTIYGVVVVFWMVFHQNGTALTEWALRNTDRTPNAIMQPIVDLRPEFAENAAPEYFTNAGPDTPRPDRSTYEVMSTEAYEKAEKTVIKDGARVPATQEMVDKVYAGVGPRTETLPPGEHLKLVNVELFQSINPGLIILFAPLMVGFWQLLARRKREPSTPSKIGMGLLLTGMSALVMVGAVHFAGTPEGKVTAWWLFGTYAVITVGELCLSPMGLSLVSKLSPPHIRSFMMGGWFLSTAVGNKLSGVFGELYHKMDHIPFFLVNTAAAIVAAGAVLALLPWLRRQIA